MMNMKKLVVAAAVSAATALSVWSQNLDRIILHSGDTIKCKVMEDTPYAIKYIYPGETMLNSENRLLIKEIRLSSGRVVAGSALHNVISDNDWKQVFITANESFTEGLKYVGSIRIGDPSVKKLRQSDSQQRMEELARKAANRRCFLAFVTGYDGGTLLEGSAALCARLYSYPFIDSAILGEIAAIKEDVAENPLGSYWRNGYRTYRSIMDDIEFINSNTKEYEYLSVLERIVAYREVADSCPKTKKYDDSQFKVACQKLEKEFAKKCKRYGYSTTPEGK